LRQLHSQKVQQSTPMQHTAASLIIALLHAAVAQALMAALESYKEVQKVQASNNACVCTIFKGISHQVQVLKAYNWASRPSEILHPVLMYNHAHTLAAVQPCHPSSKFVNIKISS